MAAFIFDIDGTIIDSMRFHERSWDVFLTRRGVPTVGEDFFRRTAGRTGVEVMRELFDSLIRGRRACAGAREGGDLSRAVQAGIPRDRRFQGVRARGSRGGRAPRVRDGRRPGQHRVRPRRARDGRLLRRRRRRARRRARQARARSLPARREAHRRPAGGVPGVRGCSARHRSRAPRGDARRGHRVDGPRRRTGRGRRTSSRGRGTSRHWTRGPSRRIFSPDHPSD